MRVDTLEVTVQAIPDTELREAAFAVEFALRPQSTKKTHVDFMRRARQAFLGVLRHLPKLDTPLPPHAAGEEFCDECDMPRSECAHLPSPAASQSAPEMPPELLKIISNAREVVKGSTYYPGKPLGHWDAVVLLADRVAELERELREAYEASEGWAKEFVICHERLDTLQASAAQDIPSPQRAEIAGEKAERNQERVMLVQAKVDAMKPVVEAAIQWRHEEIEDYDFIEEQLSLEEAVDVYERSNKSSET